MLCRRSHLRLTGRFGPRLPRRPLADAEHRRDRGGHAERVLGPGALPPLCWLSLLELERPAAGTDHRSSAGS